MRGMKQTGRFYNRLNPCAAGPRTWVAHAEAPTGALLLTLVTCERPTIEHLQRDRPWTVVGGAELPLPKVTCLRVVAEIAQLARLAYEGISILG